MQELAVTPGPRVPGDRKSGKKRRPSRSTSAPGHDKVKCFNHMKTVDEKFHGDYGVQIIGCGLCQTRVPCEMAGQKGKGSGQQM